MTIRPPGVLRYSRDVRFGVAGAVLGFLAVLAGAFGAHALRGRVQPAELAVFETAVRYQLVHALALLAVSAALGRSRSRALEWSGWLYVAGIALFSGSLYLLALTGIGWLGAITPVGGVCLLLGWVALARGLRSDA